MGRTAKRRKCWAGSTPLKRQTTTKPFASLTITRTSSTAARLKSVGCGGSRPALFAPQPESHSHHYRQRVRRRAVDPRDHRRGRRYSRFEVILRFVVIPIGQVIHAEIQFHAAADLLGDAEV